MTERNDMEPRHFGRSVGILSNLIQRRFEMIHQENGVSKRQSQILHCLARSAAENKEVYQKTLEEAFAMRSSTASQLISAMEERGLLCRTAVKKDARLKCITLTEKGRQSVDCARQMIGCMESIMCQGLSDEDKASFFRITDQMIENLKEHTER